ncbi:hypothetical protein Mal52_06730 [Symmachiella dynata]|uniref:Uncharacterized protein n=1 Tax=Symmachiella dynata TaxID=2527995 RepID=A0A517ZIC3_9PLAN|nr:hypothetical protein Mal52_06730 [Symmachiella dynata]
MVCISMWEEVAGGRWPEKGGGLNRYVQPNGQPLPTLQSKVYSLLPINTPQTEIRAEPVSWNRN